MEEPVSGPSDEQTEPTEEDNGTPVIEDENEPVEDSDAGDNSEQNDPTIVDPAIPDEESSSDSDTTTTMGAEPREALAVPVITLKKGDEALQSGATVANRANDVTFEITAVTGVSFYYTVDGTEPTTSSSSYTSAVTLTAPDKDTAETVTVKAIAHIAASGEGESAVAEQTSAVTSATVVFAEKKNTAKLDSDSAADVTIKAGETTLTAQNGVELDPAKDLTLTVTVTDTVTDKEIDKVQYKSASTEVTEWKDATAAANGSTYTIPKADLTTDLVVKASLKAMPKVTFAVAEGSSYDMFTVKLTVKKGSAILKNAELLTLTNEKKDVFIPSGTAVTAVIDAKTKCQLTKVTLGDADVKTSQTKATVNVSTSQKPLTADTIITVAATEEYLKANVAPKTEGQGTAKETKAKAWSVAPRNTYIISGIKGGNGAFAIGKAELAATVDGVTLTAVTEDQTTGEGESAVTTKVPTGNYELEVTEAAGGKTFQVKLYTTAEDKTALDTITISVAPVISKVVSVAKAAGANKDTITQSIGTEGHYALTLDSKEKTSTDTLTAEIKASTNTTNFIKDAEIVDNKGNKELVITTNAVEVTETAVEVEIKNTDMNDTSKAVLKTIKVMPAAPAWVSAAPSVKLVSATDIAVKLNITLPKGVSAEAPEGTKYVYKVLPKTGVSDNDLNYDKQIFDVKDQTTTVDLTVSKSVFGKGKAAKFDVEVQLLWQLDNGTVIASSKNGILKNAATKAPYYADKISLKKEKAASNLYTGQTAVVATVDFGKNTTFNRDEDVRAWVDGNPDNNTGDNTISVKTSATARDIAGDALTVQNGQVTLVVGKNVEPGKYTVYAEQIVDKGIPENAIQAKAALQVTVVQGIYAIDAQSVRQIYVASNKAGSAKITTVYNDGNASKKPKTAKVDYELGTRNNDGTFTEAAIDSDLAKLVTVKNGNVTVLKGYTTDKITGDKFAVRVFAKDFEENITDDVVEFEIRTTELKLGNIVLVEKKDSTYKKLDTANAIPAEKVINGAAEIKILKDIVTKTDDFAETDFVDSDLYTLSFSKKSDIGVDAAGEIWVKKPVDKVKVSAMTNDGKKNKATDLTFSVGYETVTAPKLQIKTASTFEDFTGSASSYAKAVTTPTSALIEVKAVDVVGDTPKDLTKRLVDYKVSVSGAKIISNNDDKNNLNIKIVMNKKEAVLKLTDQKGKNPVEYKITNANFDAKKAPRVTLAKGTTLYAKYDTEQTLTFNVDKWVEKNNGAPTGVKKIKVTAAPDKASQDLYNLIKDEDSKTIAFTPSTTAVQEIIIPFKSTKDVAGIKNGILRFDFVDENGAVVTQTSADVKISTALLKKSYKLTDKYNMSEKDAAKVKLVASGKPAGVATKSDSAELDVTFTKILNANINGEVNHFREAFTLDETTGVLKLVDKDKAKKDYGKSSNYKGINNLIGFVVYTVKYEDKTEETFTTKLTISIDVAKKATINSLKATAKPVMTADDMAPEIAVTNSKKAPVNLVYAEYADKSGKTFEVNTVLNYSGGTVILKLAQGVTAPSAGKVEGTLTVIPDDSMYAADAKTKYDAAKEDSATEAVKKEWTDLLEKAKIELPVKIDVKAITTANKVKVESKDSKPNFKDAELDSQAGTYTVKVPYTVVVSASVDTIAAKYQDKNKTLTPEWISFAKAADENAVNIIIDKAKYVAAVKAGTKDNKGNYKLNGKVVDATAEVTYKTATAQKDTLKFKVTPPTLTAGDLESGVTPGDETISVTVSPATASVAKGGNQVFTATVKKGDQEVTDATVTWEVAAAEGTLKTDGSTAITNGTLAIDADETATKLTVTATYTPTGGTAVTGTAEVTVTGS